MDLTVIILNWNAAEDTIRCVKQVAGWQRLRSTVWVVDNGSLDGSTEAILNACPEACLIRNAVNRGFAGGNNVGVRAALAVSDAPILLLNNDAFIAEEDVVRLLHTLQADEGESEDENKQIGFVGPLLFDADARERLLAAGGRDPVRYHHSHILELKDGAPVRVVEYVPGTVLLARPEVFRTVGLLDERYFFTMEVADLCKRAARQGYASVVDTRARAFHSLSRSSSVRETIHTYYIVRNRFLFIRKFYSRWKLLFYGVWTIYSLALWLKVRLEGKPAMARSVWLGLLDGLGGRFGRRRNELFVEQSRSTQG